MIQYLLLDGPRKQVTFSKHHHWFSCQKKFLRNQQRNSILVMCYYQDLGGTSDWLKPIFSQSEALPRYGGCCFISMEFLCLFLGGQLIGKLPWWHHEKVGCFLGLVIRQNTVLPHHYLLHQNLQTVASSSSFHHPLLFV